MNLKAKSRETMFQSAPGWLMPAATPSIIIAQAMGCGQG
jgi:hypothetical protein